jgi:cyclase
MIHNNALYKSIKFKDFIYMGDPINTIRIFNNFQVDEIIFVDIDASVNSKGPNFDLIERIASESRMPLCYGGGIKNLFEVEEILNSGVEKVSLSSQAILNPNFIKSISNNFGNQSVVCCLDVKKESNESYVPYILNGSQRVDQEVGDLIDSFVDNGAGEILINNIDRDGTLLGFDKKLVKKVSKDLAIPLTVVGGARSLNDISELIEEFGIIGVGGGRIWSLVTEDKSVLLNYPSNEKKFELFKKFS